MKKSLDLKSRTHTNLTGTDRDWVESLGLERSELTLKFCEYAFCNFPHEILDDFKGKGFFLGVKKKRNRVENFEYLLPVYLRSACKGATQKNKQTCKTGKDESYE